ncbi:MarR family winged helix-turn-helix transcriptional regulator [Rugosimonospora africana]|uniref:MarR family transcriptional regulator n=1 Tax=Rugosimonospora africana TaxID=556532 RepID=A0A8J3QVC1_9ACTN|nr:MarR family transcriptional regulator [Rugosimonospora africana]GIH15486.1 MarR family transcriptional regulator [Rugosimonospora africana]
MGSDTGMIDRWRSLSSCYHAVACQLERELQDDHDLTMSEYETLDRLIGVECEKRRMQDLAADMYLSQSALSRTVARLEKGGLVERTLCQDDRRGVFVTPTEAGVRRHAEARRTQLAILAQHLEPQPAHA